MRMNRSRPKGKKICHTGGRARENQNEGQDERDGLNRSR